MEMNCSVAGQLSQPIECTGRGSSPPTPRGSRFTHSETLVRINIGQNENRRQILTLHDPSTNLSYVDAETKNEANGYVDYRTVKSVFM